MAANIQSILQEVTDFLEPILEGMGYELVDVAYGTRNGRWVLQVFMDKESGVTIDDCARVSREIGDLIDVRDIIPHEYVLEVSSPGLDRPLKKRKDFQRATGSKVRIRTIEPREGRRNFTGRLVRVEEDKITVLVDGAEVPLFLADVDKANVVYEF